MGISPCDSDITVEFSCQFNVKLKDSKFSTLLGAFCKLLPLFLSEFFQQTVLIVGEKAMKQKKKPFNCKHCDNDEEFIWKTKHGKETKLLTIFQWVSLLQLQVQCKKCRHKFYITRQLLGIEVKQRIPEVTYRKLGLLGSLTSFRVGAKIVSMFGWAVDKMTVWKAVQKLGEEIDFKLDPNECSRGEADGTGVSINGIKMRGKELKVFIQHKKDGGVKVCGIDIGCYNGGWNNLFEKSLDVFKEFKKFLLVTDGDSSILEGLKEKVEIIYQRCLWHIPHQLKYVMWQDKIKRKSADWLYILAEVLEISAIKSLVDCEQTIKMMIESKKRRLEEIIIYAKKKGYKHIVKYLENARGDMFTAISNRLHGKTSSRVERLFRTVNMRVNIGKWSEKGILNTAKVRLAYYYNGFDA